MSAPKFPPGRRPIQLAICRACEQFVRGHELDCPHCGADVALAAVEYQVRLQETRRVASDLELLLREIGLEMTLPGGSAIER